MSTKLHLHGCQGVYSVYYVMNRIKSIIVLDQEVVLMVLVKIQNAFIW